MEKIFLSIGDRPDTFFFWRETNIKNARRISENVVQYYSHKMKELYFEYNLSITLSDLEELYLETNNSQKKLRKLPQYTFHY